MSSGGFRLIPSSFEPRHDAWFPFGLGSAEAGVRLFCLPFAGGGASAFLPLRRALDRVAVVPVQYPGHETRLDEGCAADLPSLIDSLAGAIYPRLDRPYAFLGTSMGAKIAFGLVHRLTRIGAPAPGILVAAAHRPPGMAPLRPDAARLPEPEFRDHLRHYGGTPEAVLKDAEMWALLQPILRADFALAEQAVSDAPLACPIAAYAGRDDASASPTVMADWARFTESAFSLREFDGGHFFFRATGDLVMPLTADMDEAFAPALALSE